MPVVYFFITQNIITKDHHNITIISKNPDPTLSKLNINNLTNYFNKKKLSHDKIIFNYSILIFEHVYDDIINVQRCKNEHILDSHYTDGHFYLTIDNHIWKLNSYPIFFEKIFDNHHIFLFNEILFI